MQQKAIMMDEVALPRSSAVASAGDTDDVIDIATLLRTVWRGRWVIILCALLSVAGAVYYVSQVAVPTYRSTSVIILEPQQTSFVGLEDIVGGLTGDDTEVNSELEILRSRTLQGKVVDQLGLTRDPEFNPALKPPTAASRAVERVQAFLGLGGDAAPIGEEMQRQQDREVAIDSLLEKTTFRNVPRSFVFEITVETEAPAKSTQIADAIAERYILNQLEVKFEATEQATTWLTGRVADLQVQLEEAEAAMAEFSASIDLVSIEALQAQEAQLKDIRDRIRDAEAALTGATARLQDLTAAQSADRALQAQVAGDGQLGSLLSRAESDPQMAEAFDLRFGQILARANLEVQRLTAQVAALTTSEADLAQELEGQSADFIRLQQMTRETEAQGLLYEFFLTRLQETTAQEGIQQADSRVLSYGVLPVDPVSPRKTLIVAMALVLGSLFGMAAVLVRDAIKNGFRTAQELEAFTGYSVLGQIPVIPRRDRGETLRYLAQKPTSAAAEAVRNLRTSLMLSNIDNPPQIILSTSCVPGEGKTTNSLALAQNLTGLGKSVLIIEGDIRRRTFTNYFEGLPKKGLVAVVSGEAPLEEVVHRDAVLNADIIAGDKAQTNAADIFASDRFRNFLAQMRQTYDVIVIDTPPVLVVPDARILAETADAVLFTVHWDKTSKYQVQEALRMLHASGQSITGFVLSQINPKRMKAYGYGNRYGAYSSYGHRYYDN